MDELRVVLILWRHIDLLGHTLRNVLTTVFTPHD